MAYFDKYGVEFSDDRKTLVRCPEDFEGEYVIPEEVTNIEQYAFDRCEHLTSIEIPNSVICIGWRAFHGCKSLTSVEIPHSVKRIENQCFSRCRNLKHVTINSRQDFSIEEIGNGIFLECSNLESIDVTGGNPSPKWPWPNNSYSYGLFSIDGVLYAYNKAKRQTGGYGTCNFLVAFPDGKKISTFKVENVRNIYRSAFASCRYLKRIDVDSGFGFNKFLAEDQEPLYLSRHIEEVNAPCFGKEYIRIFGEKVKRPDYLIDGQSFCWLRSGITRDFTVPDGIERICAHAFYLCSVTKIFIPSTVTEINENEPFGRCGNLIGIYVSEDNPNYSSIDGVLYNKEKTILIKCPNAKILDTLPNSVSQIMADAFERGNYKDERVRTILAEMQKQREKEEQEKRLAEEHAREEARRIAEEQRKEVERISKEKERLRIIKAREEEEQRRLEKQQMQEMLQGCILVFDTETSGLPSKYEAPISNSSNWPRLVQLAWIMADIRGNVVKKKSVIIKPDGFSIPLDASVLHGITTERALREGKPLKAVLEEFTTDLSFASQIVGHNIDFDQQIVGAELYRQSMDHNALMHKYSTCTMKSTVDFCAIPNPNSYYGGYKWPSLLELYRKLFGRSFDDAHDALADITATKDCFFELKRRGII